MSLFQNAVLKKHLKSLDQTQVDTAWQKFTAHFHDPAIQENVRNANEEQYQGGFLIDLFVNVLGYIKNPTPDFNLTTELKNIKGSKKADGAILKDTEAIAVIELKGTNTIDLTKVEAQAFGYKNNHPKCVYIITSNFEKLRFYIENAVDFEEFDLFKLSRERFEILWLCLSADNLLRGVPKRIKDESLTEGEIITKKLYKDYSQFRNSIFQDISENNPAHDKLTLFKKTQKLLDRFLFILFAEDKQLLPPNSIGIILQDWKDLRDKYDEYFPLYDRFKKYFGYLNKGFRGKKHDVFAYNGGLFLPDEILDNIKIDDELLSKHIKTLSNYDFASEVGVNILGHIFEHSLTEIENIQAQLAGAEIDKSKTKRKKDGVFYTPKYITKYIVNNTIGKLCDEKKAELEIDENNYEQRKGRRKTTIDALRKKLDKYRAWLLELTICDPACGSGAFLNQALEFLIAEHQYIDLLYTKLEGGSLIFSDIENSILENNLFGVDINEESIEIAKLSLWLRTAQKGRKLTTLNNNIKCGNSLIDDPEIAGDKAFNWKQEFPKVFANGGFDVVIGNPPYVRQQLLGKFKPFFEVTFEIYEGTSDLFAYFYEKSFEIMKASGLLGFISNAFDKTRAANKLRTFLSNQISIVTYIDFTEVQIFEDATTYPIILISRKKSPNNETFDYLKISNSKTGKVSDIDQKNSVEILQSSLLTNSWSFNSIDESNLLKKMLKFPTIKEKFGKAFRGIVTGFNAAFIINGKTKQLIEEQDESSKHLIKPLFEGKDLSKWHTAEIDKYIIFTRRGIDIGNYPSIRDYLYQFKERLAPRNSPNQQIGRKSGKYKWFEIQDSVDYYKIFESTKIVWSNLQVTNKFSIDYSGNYINAPSALLPSDDKILLSVLNSSIVWFFLRSVCVVRSGGYIEVKPQYFEQIPIPNLNKEYALKEPAKRILLLTDKHQRISLSFITYIQSQFPIEKFSKKLQSWYELEFGEFIKELNKAIKKTGGAKLSKSDEMEWMELFETKKAEAQALKAEIEKTDREIDSMVYELYGLTEEEIAIVEHSVE